MSYVCQLCQTACPSRSPMLKHIVYRSAEEKRDRPRGSVVDPPPIPAGTILREYAVCGRCQQLLQAGVPLSTLTRGVLPTRVLGPQSTNGQHQPKEVSAPKKEPPAPAPVPPPSRVTVKGYSIRYKK